MRNEAGKREEGGRGERELYVTKRKFECDSRG